MEITKHVVFINNHPTLVTAEYETGENCGVDNLVIKSQEGVDITAELDAPIVAQVASQARRKCVQETAELNDTIANYSFLTEGGDLPLNNKVAVFNNGVVNLKELILDQLDNLANPGVVLVLDENGKVHQVSSSFFEGLDGDKGDKGDQGDQGIQGVKGDKGDQGDAGVNGQDGADGADGATGAQGQQGLQGIQGVAGNDGLDGADGDDTYQIWLANGNTGSVQDFLNEFAKLTDAEIAAFGYTKDGSKWILNADGSIVRNSDVDVVGLLSIYSENLGQLAGDEQLLQILNTSAGNPKSIQLTSRRHTDGTNWLGTNDRLQKFVGAARMGFIDFGVDTVEGSRGLGFGQNATTYMVMDTTGRIGIRTLTPSEAFHLIGKALIEGEVEAKGLIVRRDGASASALFERLDGAAFAMGAGVNAGFAWDENQDFEFRKNARANILARQVSIGELMMKFDGQTGFVGIGEATVPLAKLHLKAYNIGSTNGDVSPIMIFECDNETGNGEIIEIFKRRFADGNDWRDTNFRMQAKRGTANGAFIDFGIDGENSDRGLGIGSNGMTYFQFLENGDLLILGDLEANNAQFLGVETETLSVTDAPTETSPTHLAAIDSTTGEVSKVLKSNVQITDAQIAALGYIKTDTNTQLSDADIAAFGYIKNTLTDAQIEALGYTKDGSKWFLNADGSIVRNSDVEIFGDLKANLAEFLGATIKNIAGATLTLTTGANLPNSVNGIEFRDRVNASSQGADGQITSFIRTIRTGTGASFRMVFGTINAVDSDAVERMIIDGNGSVTIVNDLFVEDIAANDIDAIGEVTASKYIISSVPTTQATPTKTLVYDESTGEIKTTPFVAAAAQLWELLANGGIRRSSSVTINGVTTINSVANLNSDTYITPLVNTTPTHVATVDDITGLIEKTPIANIGGGAEHSYIYTRRANQELNNVAWVKLAFQTRIGSLISFNTGDVTIIPAGLYDLDFAAQLTSTGQRSSLECAIFIGTTQLSPSDFSYIRNVAGLNKDRVSVRYKGVIAANTVVSIQFRRHGTVAASCTIANLPTNGTSGSVSAGLANCRFDIIKLG